jgi:hypothetical protein
MNTERPYAHPHPYPTPGLPGLPSGGGGGARHGSDRERASSERNLLLSTISLAPVEEVSHFGPETRQSGRVGEPPTPFGVMRRIADVLDARLLLPGGPSQRC